MWQCDFQLHFCTKSFYAHRKSEKVIAVIVLATLGDENFHEELDNVEFHMYHQKLQRTI